MLTNLFYYSFIQNAVIVGMLVAVMAPVIGQYLVVRRFSALADTLAHVSLVGIVSSLLLKTNPILSALVTTIIASIGIEFLGQKGKGYRESILTLFLTGSLGLSSILISLGRGFNTSIYSYLFGSINSISISDIWIVLVVFVLVLSTVFWQRKQLFIVSLDSEIAQSQGISTRLNNTLIMVLASLVISVGIQAVGVLLISSLMILPVLSSMLLKRGFYQTMICSVVFAVLSVWAGVFVSFYLGIATSGTIVMVNILIYTVSYIIPKNSLS